MTKKDHSHPVKSTVHDPSRPGVKDKFSFVVVGLGALFILISLFVPGNKSGFDLQKVGELPVLNGGRLKPIDTFARSSLLVLSGKQAIRHEKEQISAIKWFLEMIAQPALADGRPVFRIDDPDVLGLMGIQQTTKRYFSFADLHSHLEMIQQQTSQAASLKPEERSRYQSAILVLNNQLGLYNRIQNTLEQSGREQSLAYVENSYQAMKNSMAAHMGNAKSPSNSVDLKRFSELINEYSFLNQMAEFYPLPSMGKALGEIEWVSAGQGMLQSVSGPSIHPGLVAYATMADAVRADDPALFNRSLSEFTGWLGTNVPGALRKCRIEYRFNYAAPFYKSIILYLIAFLLVMVSWLTSRPSYQRAAFGLVILTSVVHTIGLFLRMVLEGRPPVTNLYSSAIFVGWVAVIGGVLLERRSRNGVGTVVSSVIGFTTLIIAHNLASQGDTLEMMRAVLDSNFWLATHVVAIAIGYSSTFLSGTLGLIYIFRRTFDRGWNNELGSSLEKMAYGVICFSLFFSFTGTILGGIWADQSWGRFWGWDPKENGALMIVLWNAFILHARWSKVASERGVMVMAVIGNIVTAVSWFGVNMLGIGLHSYGFMENAFVALLAFVLSQCVVIGLAYIRPRSATRQL